MESRLQWMKTENFSGNNGDGTFNLHGFDIRPDPETGTLRILLVNHRPPIDPLSGAPLDAVTLGANSTIELFHTRVGSVSMKHIKTYADPAIQTPNQVAWVNDDDFLFTNDHSTKVGFVSYIKISIAVNDGLKNTTASPFRYSRQWWEYWTLRFTCQSL